MEDGDQGDDQRKTRAGTELIPMGRDKEDHATGNQDGGAKQSRGSQPSHPSDVDLSLGTPVTHPSDIDLSLGTPVTQTGRRCRVGLRGIFGFKGANARGGLRIQDAGRLPAV
jgi:hypothetical protein